MELKGATRSSKVTFALTDDSSISYHVPAKINWFLEVMDKRPDGFHELCTVMQTLEWGDTLTLSNDPGGQVSLTCSNPDLDDGMDNLVMRAAHALREAVGRADGGKSLGAKMHLEKRIPIGSGLGGGSSDAAATLLVLRKLWKLDVSDALLHEVASHLGSDLNVFLTAKSQSPLVLCRGRGELTTPLENAVAIPILILSPNIVALTGQVFRQAAADIHAPRSPLPSKEAWRTPGGAIDAAFNRLESACHKEYPETLEFRRKVESLGLIPTKRMHMSGSGSSYFVVCDDEAQRAQWAQELSDALDGEVQIVETMTQV